MFGGKASERVRADSGNDYVPRYCRKPEKTRNAGNPFNTCSITAAGRMGGRRLSRSGFLFSGVFPV